MRVVNPLSIIALLALAITGCDRVNDTSKQAFTTESTVATPVSTALLEPVQLVEPIYSTGSIVAQKSTDLVPMVGGLIEEIYIAVGDRVEQGQPLLRMRKKDFQIKVDRLKQGTNLAEAELKDAERDLVNAVALKKKEVYSTEELDDRRTRVDVATAKLGIAQAMLAETQKELDDSVMRAPYRGVITKRNVDEGAYVPSVMRSGSPVLQIQKIDIMVVLLFIPEVHLQSIELGTPGRVHIPSLDRTYDSEVQLINDRLVLETRTIDVRLAIRNADYVIKPGLFIEVELMPKSRPVLILPADAIKGLGNERYLYTALNGTAQQRMVKVRELEDGRLELISGVEPEEEIIVGPARHSIQDGAAIVVRH